MGSAPALGCTGHHQLPGSPHGTETAASHDSSLSLMSRTIPGKHCQAACICIFSRHAVCAG